MKVKFALVCFGVFFSVSLIISAYAVNDSINILDLKNKISDHRNNILKEQVKEKIAYYKVVKRINRKFYQKTKRLENVRTYDKVIIIDLDNQTLKYFKKGTFIDKFKISSGNNKFPTPIGRFRIVKKDPMIWSKSAEKWMPYWMEFYDNGLYGIHAFPLDVYKKALYDDSFLGVALSGGCVRLSEKDAKTLYEWSDLETKVFIF